MGRKGKGMVCARCERPIPCILAVKEKRYAGGEVKPPEPLTEQKKEEIREKYGLPTDDVLHENSLEPMPIKTPDERQRAKNFFDKHGLVALKVLDDNQCKEMIMEQFYNIIDNQPLRDPLKWMKTGKQFRAFNKDEIYEFLTQEGHTSQQIAEFDRAWPMHKQFGATCDPEVFHLKGVWDVRQNKDIFEMQKLLLDTTKCDENRIRVDINRSIQKIPGKGDEDLFHWDRDVRFYKESTGCSGTQGKLMYTPSRFTAIPGTHKKKFLEKFFEYDLDKNQYETLDEWITKQPKHKDKYSVSKDKHSELEKLLVPFHIPTGCLVIWTDMLLHAHSKTPIKNAIEFGMYLGYFLQDECREEKYLEHASNIIANQKKTMIFQIDIQKYLRQHQDVLKFVHKIKQENGREKNDYSVVNDFIQNEQQSLFHIFRMQDQMQSVQNHILNETGDRLRSFLWGVNPLMWPSRDPICLVPQKMLNFGEQAGKILEKYKTESGRIMFRKVLNNQEADKYYPYPVVRRRIPYQRPELSDLGYQLLGTTREEVKRLSSNINPEILLDPDRNDTHYHSEQFNDPIIIED